MAFVKAKAHRVMKLLVEETKVGPERRPTEIPMTTPVMHLVR